MKKLLFLSWILFYAVIVQAQVIKTTSPQKQVFQKSRANKESKTTKPLMGKKTLAPQMYYAPCNLSNSLFVFENCDSGTGKNSNVHYSISLYNSSSQSISFYSYNQNYESWPEESLSNGTVNQMMKVYGNHTLEEFIVQNCMLKNSIHNIQESTHHPIKLNDVELMLRYILPDNYPLVISDPFKIKWNGINILLTKDHSEASLFFKYNTDYDDSNPAPDKPVNL